LFITCAVVSFVHAVSHGRRHLLVWFTSVITGTANDIFFMVLPFVDNFFHAQCTVMLTPRLPLYIPCAYIAFVYMSTTAVWRLRLNPLAQCAASGLMGGLFYAVYDCIGAKFLWWTWHDTDAAISMRWLGVPIGSTMWTIVHCFCFTGILHIFALRHKTLSISRFLATIVLSAALTTPAMMVTMGPFQLHQLKVVIDLKHQQELPVVHVVRFPGKPDPLSLLLVILVWSGIVMWAVNREGTGRTKYNTWLITRPAFDRMMAMMTMIYYAVLVWLMVAGDPTKVWATGVHQEFGKCGVTEYDLSGYSRSAYLCAENYDEDFRLSTKINPYQKPRATSVGCSSDTPPETGSTWYTICGKGFENRDLWIQTQIILSMLGMAFFVWMWDHGFNPRNRESADYGRFGVQKKKLVPNVRDLLPGPKPKESPAISVPTRSKLPKKKEANREVNREVGDKKRRWEGKKEVKGD